MDILITALGEFVWATSCAVVNFCCSSGLSVLTIFVSFLCAILASAFYKYTISRDQMSLDDNISNLANQDNEDFNPPVTITSPVEPSITSCVTATIPTDEINNIDNGQSLSDIEICVEETTDDNEVNTEETPNALLIDTVEGSEEEIQKQQIANIYRLLNDQNLINNWTTTDFLDQLKMYGLQTYEEEENDIELT